MRNYMGFVGLERGQTIMALWEYIFHIFPESTKTGDSLSRLAKLMQQIVLIIVANKFSYTDINLGTSMSKTSEKVIY